MAKYINDSAMDAALTWVRDNCTMVSLCNDQPTTVAEGTATYALGTAAYGTAGFTLGNGDTSGRKITAAGSPVVIATSGTVNHICFLNTGTILYVGTCAAVAVSSGGTANFSTFDIDEIRDPA